MFNPTTLGLVLRLETLNGVLTSGNTVTAWNDQSGKGNNLNSVTGDPRLGLETTPTGVAAVSFDGGSDGSQDSLRRLSNFLDLPVGNENRTLFFVSEYTNVDTQAGFIYGSTSNNQAFGTVASKPTLFQSGVPSVLTVAKNGAANGANSDFRSLEISEDAGWTVHSVVYENGELKVYRNGVLIDSDDASFNTVVNSIVLGANVANSASIGMNAAAVFLYDRALSNDERNEVEAYLQDTYIQSASANIAPIANIDEATVANGGAVTIAVADNDFDEDLALDQGSVTIVDGPRHGQIVSIDPATGDVRYQHDGSGLPDFFTYTITDANGNVSEAAVVDIEVNGAKPFDVSGFGEELIPIGGLIQPISMEFLPDNRILLLEKGGTVMIVDPESGRSSVYLQLENINSGSERGLLDITLDPDFETNGYFYLYYTPETPQQARIAKFQHAENAGGLTSTANPDFAEQVLWQDTDGYDACCHYGGGLDIGVDGKLWLTTADKFNTTTPGEGDGQGDDVPTDLTSTSGKIIRINTDGTIPNGTDGWIANPYINGSTDPNGNIPDSIFAYGLRNPFRARWDDEYGQFYIGEVGGNQKGLSSDSIHTASLNQAGAFYGWQFYEGVDNVQVNFANEALRLSLPQPDSDVADVANGDFYSAPIIDFPRANGTSVTGGEVYRGTEFPDEWDGVYFYGDFTRDYIRAIQLDSTGLDVLREIEFKPTDGLPGSTPNIVYLGVGRDGALYYINYDVAGGQVSRIFHGPQNNAPDIDSVDASATGAQGGRQIVFTADVSDVENDAMTFVINFGDGTTASGTPNAQGVISVTHTYANGGFYNASLAVSDGEDTAFSDAISVTAGSPNNPPTIDTFTVDNLFGDVGLTVEFTIDANDLDTDGLTYIVDFNDGSTQSGTLAPGGETFTVSHTYTTEGIFRARVSISDGQATTLSSPISIQVGDVAGVGVTDGLVLELESTIKIGLNGDIVLNWLDGSGNGNNLGAAGDPRLVQNATPSGKPAIAFDGVGDYLERTDTPDSEISGLPSGSGARTVFFVVDYGETNSVASGFVYGNAASDQAFGLTNSFRPTSQANLMVQGWGRGNDDISNVNGANAGWIVQSVVLQDDGSFIHYVNGQQIDQGSNNFNTVLNRIVIGGEIGDLGQSELSVAAIFAYDRALSESERLQVEDYLQQTYLIPGEPPNAVADTFTTPAGATLTVTPAMGLLANDSDPDLDPLTVTRINGQNVVDGQAVSLTKGVLTINDDGSFTYVQNPGATGQEVFTYTISDGTTGTDTATATITIQSGMSNVPPVANDDAYTGTQNTPLTVGSGAGLVANDTDANGDALTVSRINGAPVTNGQTVALTHGDLTINANGSFTYAPDAGYLGQDFFNYHVIDPSGAEDFANVTITINQGGGGPGGVPVQAGLVTWLESTENVALDGPGVVNGWLDGSGNGNDLMAIGAPTLVDNATPTGRRAIAFDGVDDALARIGGSNLSSLPSGAEDRTVFFVVDYKNHNGVSAGAVFGDGAQNQTFGLATHSVNDDLLVQGWGRNHDQASGVPEGNGVGDDEWLVQSVVLDDNAFRHFLNGALIDSGTKTFNTDTAAATSRLIIGGEIAGLGFASMDVAAVLIYDRALTEQERGLVETYLQEKYITGESSGGSAPTATDDSYSGTENTTLTVAAGQGLLANDNDPDSDPLTVTQINGVNVTNGQTVALANGDLTINANGSFSFMPDAGFSGLQTFAYTVADGVDGSDAGSVTIDIADVSGPLELPVLTGLVTWLETTDGVTQSGGSVTGWLDASTAGMDLVGSGGPTLATGATPTGLDAIAFDGVNDALARIGGANLSALPSGAEDRTVFFVVDYKNHNGVSAGAVYGDGAQNQTFGLATHSVGDDLLVQGWGRTHDQRSGVPEGDGVGDDEWLVQSVVLDDNAFQHFLNGALIDSGTKTFNTDTAAATSKLIIGSEIAGLGFASMDVAAVLIYDRALDAAERDAVESYLLEKYITGGIGATASVVELPSDPDTFASFDLAPVPATDGYRHTAQGLQGIMSDYPSEEEFSAVLMQDNLYFF